MKRDEDRENYPWIVEKRSWIFYIDKIKNNEWMVTGETDDAVYFLDCRTAKLSVWVKKCQTFTEIGATSFLEQMEHTRYGKIPKIFNGTRILYKGIELQNSCVEDETELIEYIDIKAELNAEYINISRNDFTEKGRRYFQNTLKPELLRGVQSALNDLRDCAEKACKQGETNRQFKDLICDIAGHLCNEIEEDQQCGLFLESKEKQDELISLVVTSALLSYCATKEKWDIMEYFGRKSGCVSVWDDLIKSLDEILYDHKEVLKLLEKRSVLFQINAIGENFHIHLARGSESRYYSNMHFLKLFLPDMHWAILQTRESKFDSWKSYLVLLETTDDKSDVFKKIISFPRSKETEEEIETWGTGMCNPPHEIPYENDYGMSMLCRWMQKLIPTVALFSNCDGNIRLNVLYNRIAPSIYVNENFKKLILERLLDNVKDEDKEILPKERFSTITWQKRERLGLEDLPFSVFFVRRGYLSRDSYYKSIVPFEKDFYENLGGMLNSLENSENFSSIQKLCNRLDFVEYLVNNSGKFSDDLKEYWEKESGNVKVNVSMQILQTILMKMQQDGFQPELTGKQLLDIDEECFGQWEKIYLGIAELQACERYGTEEEANGIVEELQENQGWSSLCSAWMYCTLFEKELLKETSNVEKLYKIYMNNNAKRNADVEKKILDYIEKNSSYKLQSRMIKEEWENYKREWVELGTSMEQDYLLRPLEKLLSNYEAFAKEIAREYTNFCVDDKRGNKSEFKDTKRGQ